ncbi:hypothetical protein CBS101457_004286 [Exobasidium rhododendri]|nr:hypothetical protein CBS101457_004286 [Exobasidium rhododendri]
MRKESYDGARVVAGVGIGASSTTVGEKGNRMTGMNLRQAFGQEVMIDNREDITSISRGDSRDSISSIVDLEERRVEKEEEKQTTQQEEALPRTDTLASSTVSLFGSAATPILSRQDAVALRNVGCLDFAGRQEGTSTSGDTHPKNLRKMRSVDALQLALLKMEKQQQISSKAPSQNHFTIPESFSTDSLTNEDFANAKTTTTLLVGHISPGGTSSEHAGPEEPIKRSFTPQLMITSPTGMRSPQPLHLEGQEFEPRSISPESVKIVRPVASRRSGWKLNAFVSKPEQRIVAAKEESQRGKKGDAEVSDSSSMGMGNIPRHAAACKKKSRMHKSKEGVVREGEEAHLPIPSKRGKKRMSKSCNDLRGNALAQVDGNSAKLSGSEQIRALRRDVMKRKSGSAGQSSLILGDAPCSATSNEDDPFNDFVDVLTSSSSSVGSRSKAQSSHMDWSGKASLPIRSSSQRRPLSTSFQNNLQQTPTTNNVIIPGKVLTRKTSGVGLACLVEKENSSRATTNSASLSKNTMDSLLDSPTAHHVKKKSSRPRLNFRVKEDRL